MRKRKEVVRERLVAIRLTQDEIEFLQLMARQHEQTMSAFVRQAIKATKDGGNEQ